MTFSYDFKRSIITIQLHMTTLNILIAIVIITKEEKFVSFLLQTDRKWFHFTEAMIDQCCREFAH